MKTEEGHNHIRQMVEWVCSGVKIPQRLRISQNLKDFLHYLLEYWVSYPPTNSKNSNEIQIGIDFFKLDKNWSPSDNPIVRQNVLRLRQRLRGNFQYCAEGRTKPYQLALLSRPYALTIIRNRLELPADERFWDLHAISGEKNLIIHTEPLWFWDREKRAFTRFLDINNDSLNEFEIKQKLPANHPARLMTPCFHFQSAGEIEAVQHLENWLTKNHIDHQVKLSRDLVLDTVLLGDANLIVVGNGRSNKFVTTLQEKLQILLLEQTVVVQMPSGTKEYKDDDMPAARDRAQSVYILVTRQLSRDQEGSVTIIAGNNGRGIERVAEVLTSPVIIGNILDSMQLPVDQALPLAFQIVLRVKILDYRPVHREPQIMAFSISGQVPIILEEPEKNEAQVPSHKSISKKKYV